MSSSLYGGGRVRNLPNIPIPNARPWRPKNDPSKKTATTTQPTPNPNTKQRLPKLNPTDPPSPHTHQPPQTVRNWNTFKHGHSKAHTTKPKHETAQPPHHDKGILLIPTFSIRSTTKHQLSMINHPASITNQFISQSSITNRQ